jgi:3'(2'), 5'-bisphosphate nucleotidase
LKETAINSSYERELRVAIDLARQAGAAALKYYGTPLLVEHKSNFDEPVTQADYAANTIIIAGLKEAFPDDGLLSEESKDTSRRLGKERVWIIDPLDGTGGFIAGDGDFAVQIGLAVGEQSVLGVVYQPVPDILYWACKDKGSWVVRPNIEPERLSVSDEINPNRMRIAVSRSHRSPRMDRVIRLFNFKEEVRRGSVGIKIGLIVERMCDLYIHLSSRVKEWDTCAPSIILHEAGGELTDLFGIPLRYNQRDVQHHNGLVATNRVSHERVIKELAPLLEEFGRRRVEEVRDN